MKRFLFVFALFIFCVNTNLAQQTSAEKLFEIKGFAKNQDKIPLAGLNLFFESNDLKRIVTDASGVFSIKLPVGKYKVTAHSAVSKNFTAFIEVFDNNLNPTNFDLIVETDKDCCGQTSDGKTTEVVKYVAPHYPPAARATRTTGEVVVNVKIDREGKVISSKAEVGHPFLKANCELIAKEWIFSTDANMEEREGKIIFAFVPTDKKTENIFTKPNRLMVFADLSQLTQIDSY